MASAKEWWYSPGMSFLRPPQDPVSLLIGLREQGTTQQALSSFGRLVFPPLSDAEALLVECTDYRARGWIEDFFDGGYPGAFRHAESIMMWLQQIAEDVMCQPLAVRKVEWQDNGSFSTWKLLPRGVERLPSGRYRVYPPLAHWWYQEHHPAEPYELGERSVLLFRRPAKLSKSVPLVQALSHHLDSWLEDHKLVTHLEALARPENTSIRAQAARLRKRRLPSVGSLPDSRVVRVLHGSLAELQSFGSYAPVTEHYLAWQHREATRVAVAVRESILDIMCRELLRRSASKAGFDVTGFRLLSRNTPSQDNIDVAFEDFVAGRTGFRQYLDRTLWR